MQTLETSVFERITTKHNIYNSETGHAEFDYKSYMQEAHICSYPTKLNDDDAVKFIEEQVKSGKVIPPQHIPEQVRAKLKRCLAIHIPSKSMIRYTRDTLETQPYIRLDRTQLDGIKAQIQKSIKGVDLGTHAYLRYFKILKNLIRNDFEALSKCPELELIQVGTNYCVYYPALDSAYIYYNTIPEVQNYIPYKHLYFGYHYPHYNFNLPLLRPSTLDVEIVSLYTIIQKPNILETQTRKLISELKPFELKGIKNLFHKYTHRAMRGDMIASYWWAFVKDLDALSAPVLYETEKFSIILDLVEKETITGFSTEFPIPELNETLKSSGFHYTEAVELPISSDIERMTGDIDFDNDANHSLNLDGSKHRVMRNAKNRLDKQVQDGDLIIKYDTDLKSIQSISEKELLSFIDKWRLEFNKRKKPIGEKREKGSMTFMILTMFSSLLLPKMDDELLNELEMLLIRAYDPTNNQLQGYLLSFRNTHSHFYQQENCTLNSETRYKKLREYTVILDAMFWRDRTGNRDITMAQGIGDTPGLRIFKTRDRPIKAYKCIYR